MEILYPLPWNKRGIVNFRETHTHAVVIHIALWAIWPQFWFTFQRIQSILLNKGLIYNKEHTLWKLVGDYCWSLSQLTKFWDLLSSEWKVLFTFLTWCFVSVVEALHFTRFPVPFDKSGKMHKLLLRGGVEVTGANSLTSLAVLSSLRGILGNFHSFIPLLFPQCNSCKVIGSAVQEPFLQVWKEKLLSDGNLTRHLWLGMSHRSALSHLDSKSFVYVRDPALKARVAFRLLFFDQSLVWLLTCESCSLILSNMDNWELLWGERFGPRMILTPVINMKRKIISYSQAVYLI